MIDFGGRPRNQRNPKKAGQFQFGYSALIAINFETEFSCMDGTAKPVAEWGVAISYTFPKNAKGTGKASFKFSKSS
jgi:hypothetical protein